MSKNDFNETIQDISVLYELSLSIGNSLTIEKNCEAFLRTLMSLKNVMYSAVWIQNQCLSSDYQPGATLMYAAPASYIREQQISSNDSLWVALASQEYQVISYDSPIHDQICHENTPVAGTYILIRLGEIGFLKLFTLNPENWQNQFFISQLRNIIAKFTISLEGCLVHHRLSQEVSDRKDAQSKLEYLSLHDKLTGLYNRTSFDHKMNQLSVAKTPVAIIVCDLDGLKLINDTFGHVAGDNLLVAAANALSMSCRAQDFIARIGGDEFAILLSDCSQTSAEAICKRISCAEAQYTRENPCFVLSISTGFALSSQNASLYETFNEADNAMYREKRHRRQAVRTSIANALIKALETKTLGENQNEQILDIVAKLACEPRSPIKIE